MPLVIFAIPVGLIPLCILGLRLHWTSALRSMMTSGAADCTSTWLSSWMILGTMMSVCATACLPILVTRCTPSRLSAFAISLITFSFHRNLPFTGIDVLIIHGVLDSTAGSGDYLSNLVLFLMQFELYQELCKHGVGPIQSDVGLSQLMLAIETVSDIPNCTIVLSNGTEGVIDKRYNSVDAHSALSLCIDSIDVASLQAMHILDRVWLEVL